MRSYRTSLRLTVVLPPDYNRLTGQMSVTKISLTIPLAEARRVPKAGGKAISLSELIEAHFAVPRGFVIGVDAYRSHLWASGARGVAAADPTFADAETIRTAILGHEMPQDLADAVHEAYRRLALRTGFSEPKVAVRASPLEESAGVSGKGVPETAGWDRAPGGACPALLNVSGPDELVKAVRRVWASLWSQEAVRSRAASGQTGEPGMAVIVQQMVEAKWSGAAITAGPATGNPSQVVVRVNPGAWEYRVSLSDLSIECARGECPGGPALEFIASVAEKAVLAEKLAQAPVEMDWAADRDGIWTIRLKPAAAPGYFPLGELSPDQATRKMRRVTGAPVSTFSRELLRRGPEECGPFAAKSVSINGYVYLEEAPKRLRGVDRRDIAAAFGMLQSWNREWEPDLRSRSGHLIRAHLTRISHEGLARSLKEARDVARIAHGWLLSTSGACEIFTEALAHFIAKRVPFKAADSRDQLWEESAEHKAESAEFGRAPGSLLERLLGGLPDGAIERDALLQEFGDRFVVAEATGKVDDRDWWLGYKGEVEAFALEYRLLVHKPRRGMGFGVVDKLGGRHPEPLQDHRGRRGSRQSSDSCHHSLRRPGLRPRGGARSYQDAFACSSKHAGPAIALAAARGRERPRRECLRTGMRRRKVGRYGDGRQACGGRRPGRIRRRIPPHLRRASSPAGPAL